MVRQLLRRLCRRREMMESMSTGDVTAVRRRGGLVGLLLDGGVEGNEVSPDLQDDPASVSPTVDELLPEEEVCPDPRDCRPPPATVGNAQ
jgi:hypothetical protein